MKNIIIFASGSGSNAQRIVEYFRERGTARVTFIYVNRPDAYVLERAHALNLPSFVFGKKELYETNEVYEKLVAENPDLIVLAGFLWKIPEVIVNAFPQRIINIHPALLPKFGGKGMYGSHVHEAVIENKEKESGITIHWVNNQYDEGDIIAQAKCTIIPGDTPDTLARKIHLLEYQYFSVIIEKTLLKQ